MTSEVATQRRQSSRVLRWLLAALIAMIALGWTGFAILVHRAGPYLKEQIIRDLNERFHAKTEIESLDVSVFPELRAFGQNLIVRREDDDGEHPFLAARSFSIEASPWSLLIRPMRIGAARVQGLSIIVPRVDGRPHPDEAEPTTNQEGSKPGSLALVIENLVIDHALLEILPGQRGKLPIDFEIQNLTMRDAGPGQAMSFSAKLTNPKPIGLIDTVGSFGPWNGDAPRKTPVSGSYSFSDADLSTVTGIGGILKSRGQFHGQLGTIDVTGETDTPDFTVSTGRHPMALHTEFSATVDGSSGDTYLHPVNAVIGRSRLVANGLVVREARGHRIVVTVTSSDARVEDLLNVAVRTEPPLLSGPISLRTRLVLPAANLPVPERLQLQGSFELSQARFQHGDVQDKIDRLSARAEGHPKEANEGGEAPEILSSLKSDFNVGRGVIQISRLTFQIPGGTIELTGEYQLTDAQFAFNGHARLHAKLSQMTTGVKSFFLRAVDPFFSRDGAGTVLPIKITGTGTHPKIALDLGRARSGK